MLFIGVCFKSLRTFRKWGIIMEKPILSPKFTIEDIHKLREYNYYQTKDMTSEERMDYYNSRGMEVHREIQSRKHERNLTFPR